MKKYTQASVSMRTNTTILAVLALLVSVGIGTHVYAYNTIDSQLDLGKKNSDVTNLQTFFRDNSTIYPEGLVTGYFGNLTRSSVIRFQAQNGIAQAGRVGPATRDRINTLINSGGWTTSDASGPAIYSVTQSSNNNSITLGWNTDEIAIARVFYGTNPIMMNEGDINSVGFGSTNGFVANNNGLARTSQQVTVSNLQPNTQYYYVVVATDPKGNVSLWNPNTTMRTNQ
jgi:peptidoglycan hydrolase-like protein with peptidoglycan-binding domain